uniref:Uncharacterized protein n=1 Tax=Anguilla anguilla TaxID=7936 RepID=A0A0E9XCS6_ANGAN
MSSHDPLSGRVRHSVGG